MALRIFDTDPDAKPQKREKRTYVEAAFTFRSGMQVKDPDTGKGKPKALDAWRVLTDSNEVADGIAELLGGTAEEYDPTNALNFHVLTESPAVEVVIDGAKSIEDKLILWGPHGPIHECDGVNSLLPEDKGEPCKCPALMVERQAKAKSKRGPAPWITVNFKLAGAGEDLGPGKAILTSWKFAEVVHEVKEALDQVDGPALCRLELELVEFVSKKYGPVSYRKPVITVLGSYNDAIAEER